MSGTRTAPPFMALIIPVVGDAVHLTHTIDSLTGQSVRDFRVLLGHGQGDASAAAGCARARKQLALHGVAEQSTCLVVPGAARRSDIANALLLAADARYVRVLEPGWTLAPFAIELEEAFVRAHVTRTSVMLEGVRAAADQTPFAPVNAAAIVDWCVFTDAKLLLEPLPASALIVPREAIERGVVFSADRDVLGPWSYPLAVAHDAVRDGRRLLQLGAGLLREPADAPAMRTAAWRAHATDHRDALRSAARDHLLRRLRPHAPAEDDALWFGERLVRRRTDVIRLARTLAARCPDLNSLHELSLAVQQILASDPDVAASDVPLVPLPDLHAEFTRATYAMSDATLRLLIAHGTERSA